MLTGHADAALVGTALALDVDAFVLKPVSRAALETRIRRIFAQPQGVKPPAHYQDIDLKAATNAVLRAQKGIIDRAPESKAAAGVDVELDAIVLPATLAADIVAPTGELLLGAGMALTARLLERLKELRVMGIVPATLRLREDASDVLRRA